MSITKSEIDFLANVRAGMRLKYNSYANKYVLNGTIIDKEDINPAKLVRKEFLRLNCLPGQYARDGFYSITKKGLEFLETASSEETIFDTYDTPDLPWKEARKAATVMHAQIDTPFMVRSREGIVQGQAGDHLMKNPAGELYICANDVFESTYEDV